MPSGRTVPYLEMTLIGLFAMGIVYAFAAPLRHLIYFFSDDAYYYYKVAQNILAGNGSTFDGFNQTNGYHPLWMLVLLPVFAITRTSPLVSLRTVLALLGMLGALSWMLCWSYIRMTGSRLLCIVGTVLLLSSPALLLTLNGLESGLLIFWIFLMLALDLKCNLLAAASTPRSKFLLGVLFALLVLIRLDSMFFVAALLIFKLIFSPFRNPIHKLGFLFRTYWPAVLAFCVLVIPYLVFNVTVYGHMLPISGTLKTSFPIPHFNPPNAHTIVYVLGILAGLLWALFSSLSPGGYLRTTLFPRWRLDSPHGMLAVFWLGCLLHLIWTSLFMQWGVYQWHYAAHVPILVILVAFAVQAVIVRFGHETLIKTLALSFALFLMFGLSVFTYLEKGSHLTQRYEAAEWARKNTDPNTVFAMHDAGCFAYFAERPTVNLDGVINSFEFQDVIRDGTLREFLDGLGLKYIASATVDSEKRVFTKRIRHCYGKRRGENISYKVKATQDAEVFSTEPLIYRPLTQKRKVSLIVWEFAEVELERVVRP